MEAVDGGGEIVEGVGLLGGVEIVVVVVPDAAEDCYC